MEWLAIGAAAEHDQAAGRGTGHKKRDQPKRLGRAQPLPLGKADAHSRRVAAHERDEQAAEMKEADAIDVAGERRERAGEGYVAAGIEHRPETDPSCKTAVFTKAVGLGSGPPNAGLKLTTDQVRQDLTPAIKWGYI